MSNTHLSVREYYGKTLAHSGDLRTSACCVAEAPPAWLRSPLANIHEEVAQRFYGCGFPIAEAVEGRTVLDLGCGSGRDVYLLSQLVGPAGRVHGIDMTKEQLEIAERTKSWHMERFGFKESNVAFHEGFIEELTTIEDSSIDLVVSNCVLNLSPRKDLVLREVHRVLKPGGEFLFSDVFSDRRLPSWMMEDRVLLGECLGGALYTGDFQALARKVGFLDPRRLSSEPVEVKDPEIRSKVGTSQFQSDTWRLFKLEGLESQCEDYGQVATYAETIPEVGPVFRLDDHHLFELGRPERVCGNTASMLTDTRLAPYFQVTGDRSVHFGLFPCGATLATESRASGGAAVSSPTSGCC